MSNLEVIIHKCRPPETGYWAEVPSLPGCVTQGETLEETRAMVRDAIAGWLETAWHLSMKGRRISKSDIREPAFA